MKTYLKNLLINTDKWFYNTRLNLFTHFFGIPPRPFVQKVKERYGSEPITGVEIGVMYGDHAFSILNNLNINELILIDPFLEYKGYDDDFNGYGEPPSDSVYRAVVARFSPYKNINLIRDYSHIAINKVLNNVDFVYIDGNHSYEYVKQDIELYWNKIKPGGMIGGHDIGNGSCKEHEGIIKAITEFALKNNLQIYIDQPDWWLIKNDKNP